MDISVVDLNRVEVYEAGASLITLLAYPREKEEVWAQVHASLCNYALRIKSASEPDLATVPQPMKPIYAFRLQQDISRDLRTLERRIRDRMIAGRMGIGFPFEPVVGVPFEAAAFRVNLQQPVNGLGLKPGGFGHALGGTARRGTQQQAHAVSGEDAQDRVDDGRLAYPGPAGDDEHLRQEGQSDRDDLTFGQR